jgi:hypothetical protein
MTSPEIPDSTPPAPAAGVPAPGVWVHAYEEDGPEGMVFRLSGQPFALSRRPRRRIELVAGDGVRVADGGPDDRLVSAPAAAVERGGVWFIRCADGALLRIVAATADRLVVAPEAG